MVNKEELKTELSKLVKYGDSLYLSVFKTSEQGLKKLKGIKIDPSKLPDFKQNYEDWYTRCYRLIQNVAPYRLNDFSSMYKIEKRKQMTIENYCISDALLGYKITSGIETIAEPFTIADRVKTQVNILDSINGLIEDYFYNLETELETNIFDSELDAAYELLRKKFVRSAGAIAGVIIERHLSNVCEAHGIKIAKKDPTISDFNDKLKEQSVINVATWRKIQYLADIRNMCPHNKKEEPTEQQVQELLDGTKNLISTIF